MADEDANPFASPSEVNPFADPSVKSATGGPSKNLGDYNPFAEQASRPQTTTAQTPPASTAAYIQPATIEPTKAEAPPSYTPYSIQSQSDQEAIRRRQEELERKDAELTKKENELRVLQQQVIRENNFPPLPKKFCPNPCFYHDISVDIPIEFQKTCRMVFYVWQLYSFALLYNCICSLALLIVGGDNGAETFGVSLLYLVLFVPCSFIFWYRALYKAFKNDSSFNYMLFFFVFFFQILCSILYALGIPAFGTCGWINAGKTFDKSNKGIAAMMFVSGALFTVLAILKIILLKKIHSIYRTTGASLEKAQGEFARGVMTNKDVQNAAAEAAKTGIQAQAARY
ncbi:secretory carrier-associated membrane protein 1-like [Rhopilema esculentum]|uniref:secretory carrier-associated membrane protein 1-like n=1 Tax=Rhopilema esculentum TaxID=499914 RepID=UPI0031DEAB3D|eukprot:gene5993-11361_t